GSDGVRAIGASPHHATIAVAAGAGLTFSDVTFRLTDRMLRARLTRQSLAFFHRPVLARPTRIPFVVLLSDARAQVAVGHTAVRALVINRIGRGRLACRRCFG